MLLQSFGNRKIELSSLRERSVKHLVYKGFNCEFDFLNVWAASEGLAYFLTNSF